MPAILIIASASIDRTQPVADARFCADRRRHVCAHESAAASARPWDVWHVCGLI